MNILMEAGGLAILLVSAGLFAAIPEYSALQLTTRSGPSCRTRRALCLTQDRGRILGGGPFLIASATKLCDAPERCSAESELRHPSPATNFQLLKDAVHGYSPISILSS